MSDTNEVVAEVPAPELEATAAPETEVAAPEAAQPETPATKTFTQEEMDAAVGKRLARERRKWEREQAARSADAPRADAPLPAREEDPEGYAEALAERKAAELLTKREAEREQQERISAYQEREDAVREKYEDFEQVAYNPQLRITTVMAETIQASDIGPELAYYLGMNPKEADRISRLPPFLQAKEIGRMEAKLADAPPVRKTTNAPPPIRPVTARATGAPVRDTTDPRSVKELSTSEWIEAERERQRKQWEARNR
jgi:hypothetical protein